GGFLGVEVFFVISGYLITSLLLTEWLRNGRVDLKGFWIRRARRLLPAVMLLLATVSIGAMLFYRDVVDRLAGDVVAALGYFTNWFLIVREVSYFESFGRPSLLQHLWSLSIEEQFYLVWPILFSVGFWLTRRRRARTAIRTFALVTVLGALASATLMAVLFVPFEDPSRVYYGTDTRVGGILVGVALAFLWIPWRLGSNPGRTVKATVGAVGWGCLLGVVTILATMDEFSSFLYRGGFLVTSLLTAGVIAAAVHPARVFGPVLDNPVARWVGTRSYGIYLWHWPVLMVTRPGVDVADNRWVTFSFRLALTFLIAEISYQAVESPIRRLGVAGWLRGIGGLARGGMRRHGAPAAGVALLGLSVVVAAVIVGSTGIPATAVAGTIPPPAVSLTAIDGSAPPSTSPPSTPEAPAVLAAPSLVVPTEPDVVPVVPVDEPVVAPTAPLSAPVTTTTLELMPPSLLPSISFVGDSVMSGARREVVDMFVNTVWVDAEVNRQFRSAPRILDRLAARGQLGDVVVVHLGTNGPFSATDLDEVMGVLASCDRVVFVTAKVPRRWEDAVNRTILEGADRWPQIDVFDWHTIGNEHPDWFYSDRVHLNGPGKIGYVTSLQEFLNEQS
ncbi:MAG: acyltransferase, partial [Acidimicrobiia bacterium]|nr:acyltransferase [Acidimicrobiia bacterium]